MKGYDKANHGTHVCGTIAGSKTRSGVSIGVAPQAHLLVAALPQPISYLSELMRAVSWAIEEGAEIINISYGWRVSYYDYAVYSRLFNDIKMNHDIMIVVSTGNRGYGTIDFPGNVYTIFSVGAIYQKNDRSHNKQNRIDIAPFSGGASLLPIGETLATTLTKPNVVAPGVNVYSCVPSKGLLFRKHPYNYMNGTSMAAPHVAGVAALLKAAHPGKDLSRIQEVLESSAFHPKGGTDYDNVWGKGLIQPFKAYSELGQ